MLTIFNFEHMAGENGECLSLWRLLNDRSCCEFRILHKKGKKFYFEGRWEHEKIYVLCVCKFVIIPNYSELFDSDFCLVNTIVRLHLNHDARKFFNTFV